MSAYSGLCGLLSELLRRLRQYDHKFKACLSYSEFRTSSLDNLVRLCHKIEKKNQINSSVVDSCLAC